MQVPAGLKSVRLMAAHDQCSTSMIMEASKALNTDLGEFDIMTSSIVVSGGQM